MKTWKLDAATAGFAEVAREALAHQPQRVELGEHQAVVVISAADYAMLAFARDLVDFVRRSSPPVDLSRSSVAVRIARDRGADARPDAEDA